MTEPTESGAYGHAGEALARLRAADEGKAAALAGDPITTCPYRGDWSTDARRRSWESAWRATDNGTSRQDGAT